MARRKLNETKESLVESFSEFARFKNIDRATLMSVLEEVFRTMIRKKYGSDENFDVIINVDKGDIQAFREREIVEDGEVEDEATQISLSEALEVDEDSTVGELMADEVSFADFGRKMVQTAKQTLTQKVRDLEKQVIYEHYKELVGEIVVGEVYQIWRNEIMVIHEGNELILPKKRTNPQG